MMLTFAQIEDVRDNVARGGDGTPCLSLQQAARNVGLPFEQCPECKGSGYTKATLLVNAAEIEALSKINPKGYPPIQYDRCDRCRGDGGWLKTAGMNEEILELRAALRNMADAYQRRVRSLCTPEEIAKQPWRCAEYLEAERLCKRPFKLLMSEDQLRRLVEREPDDVSCEAGILHPEAPIT